MLKTDWVVKSTLVVIALLLSVIALNPYIRPVLKASADVGRFDYVSIVSPMFLYKGAQGVLLLDKRNGNVWFIHKGNEMEMTYKDPLFVVHFPLEKLDQAPR